MAIRKYKRDRLGRFAGIGSPLQKFKAHRKSKHKSKLEAKRLRANAKFAKKVDCRDHEFHDLQTTKNQFSRSQALRTIDAQHPELAHIAIPARSALKNKPVSPLYRRGSTKGVAARPRSNAKRSRNAYA